MSIWETKWELMIPVIILIGVFGGYSTIVETASLTLIYVFFIEFFIHKDIELENLFKIIIQCSCLIGCVLIILGVAMGLTSYLVDAQVPMAILNWVKMSINSKYTFLGQNRLNHTQLDVCEKEESSSLLYLIQIFLHPQRVKRPTKLYNM